MRKFWDNSGPGAGELPAAESNGQRYLKIPIDQL